MKLNEQFIINAFRSTKRTSTKIITLITEYYDPNAKKTIYFVDMTDGTRYIYSYEQTAQHNYSCNPRYYHRILKIK